MTTQTQPRRSFSVSKGSSQKIANSFQTLRTNFDETVACFFNRGASGKIAFVKRGMSNNQRHFTEPFLLEDRNVSVNRSARVDRNRLTTVK
jgi:hypothetical protein